MLPGGCRLQDAFREQFYAAQHVRRSASRAWKNLAHPAVASVLGHARIFRSRSSEHFSGGTRFVEIEAARRKRLAGSRERDEKGTHRPARRGRILHVVDDRVTVPVLPEPRKATLEEDDSNAVHIGQSLVYLHETGDPAAGILEIERPYLENSPTHRYGLIPATVLCGAYVGWRVARRLRKR
jgi:hypothetical protein